MQVGVDAVSGSEEGRRAARLSASPRVLRRGTLEGPASVARCGLRLAARRAAAATATTPTRRGTSGRVVPDGPGRGRGAASAAGAAPAPAAALRRGVAVGPEPGASAGSAPGRPHISVTPASGPTAAAVRAVVTLARGVAGGRSAGRAAKGSTARGARGRGPSPAGVSSASLPGGGASAPSSFVGGAPGRPSRVAPTRSRTKAPGRGATGPLAAARPLAGAEVASKAASSSASSSPCASGLSTETEPTSLPTPPPAPPVPTLCTGMRSVRPPRSTACPISTGPLTSLISR